MDLQEEKNGEFGAVPDAHFVVEGPRAEAEEAEILGRRRAGVLLTLE